jgi:uncharacterized protein YkwD
MEKLEIVSTRRAAQPRHYSRLMRGFLTTAMLLVGSPASAQTEPGFANRVEARVLSLVNELRGENGLKPLERERRLDAAAEHFGIYMASTGKLEHDADGRTPAARVKQQGYVYCVISENIAYEYNSRGFMADRLARNFVDGWRDSPPHRDNMLDDEVTQTGVAIARSERGEYYAVQLFGRPAVAGAKGGATCRRR